MTVPEVANRATISGAIEIGRHPGVVQVTFRAPIERLEACGLLHYAVEQYGRVPRRGVDGSAGAAAGGNGRTAATPGGEGTAPSGA